MTCVLETFQNNEHYPVLEVFDGVLQQLLELNGAVGHKVVVANRRVVKHRQLDLPAVVHLRHKLVVPGGTVRPLFGRGLTHAKIVHVEGDVRVQQKRLRLGSDGVSEGPGCGLQVQSLADLNLQQTVKNHHGVTMSATFPTIFHFSAWLIIQLVYVTGLFSPYGTTLNALLVRMRCVFSVRKGICDL